LFLIIAICSMVIQKLPAADWTILVYMAADNGLNDNAVADINEMEAANINSGINVFVQIDESEYSQTPGARRYKIQHDTQIDHISSPIVQDLGEIDSGDYHNLVDFANWGFRRYPATHKMLVLWSHGNSWYKGADSKWICTDNTSHDAIGVWNGQLKDAISDITKPDILLFDACSMQALEVLNEVYGNTNYVIGSEDLVPVTGFPYKDILNAMHSNMGAEELSLLIPQLYVDSYNPYQSQNPDMQPIPVSCSYADCSEFPQFRQKLDAFAAKWKPQADQFIQIREQLLNFNDMQADVDFNDFMDEAIRQNLPELSGLYNDATELQNAFRDVFPQQFNNEYIDIPAGYATIWFPPVSYIFGGLWQHYGYLDWAETAWSGFLNEFVGPDSIPPLKPKIMNVHQEMEHLYITWQTVPDPDELTYRTRFVYDAGGEYNTSMISGNSYVMHIFGNGTLYLEAEDQAGNRSSPDSVRILYKKPTTQMYYAPTPVRDITQSQLHIYVPKNDEYYTLRIYDISGKLMVEKRLYIPSHTPPKTGLDNEYILELRYLDHMDRMSSGIYETILTGGGVTLRTKLVIVK